MRKSDKERFDAIEQALKPDEQIGLCNRYKCGYENWVKGGPGGAHELIINHPVTYKEALKFKRDH